MRQGNGVLRRTDYYIGSDWKDGSMATGFYRISIFNQRRKFAESVADIERSYERLADKDSQYAAEHVYLLAAYREVLAVLNAAPDELPE